MEQDLKVNVQLKVNVEFVNHCESCPCSLCRYADGRQHPVMVVNVEFPKGYAGSPDDRRALVRKIFGNLLD